MKSKKVTTWTEMAACKAVGVDVSKETLEIAGRRADGETFSGSLPNNAVAISSFIKTLVQRSFSGTILCEATSHYHLILAVMACEAGLDIRVINPLLSSKHAKSAIRKTKTDRVDALVLATMVLTEPNLPPPARLPREHCRIRHTLGLIQSLERHLQGMKRALSSYQERVGQLGLEPFGAYQEITASLQSLQKNRDILLSQLESFLLEVESDQKETIARVDEIPGITKSSAALFVFALDPKAKSAKSWIAYAGLDVAIKESGKWKGHGKLTKRGPAWLRKRLHQVAWGAAMNYPPARLFYDALKAKGRKHNEAVIIIAKKLLCIMFALITKEKTFDPEVAFRVAA